MLHFIARGQRDIAPTDIIYPFRDNSLRLDLRIITNQVPWGDVKRRKSILYLSSAI